MPHPARPPRRTAAALAVCVLLATACSALGIRADVDPATARTVLDRAVDLALSPQLGQLCTLSTGGPRSEASTCPSTLDDLAELVPDAPPTVRCAVDIGDEGPLRGGTVLVVEGLDGQGEEYVTEFVVYDDGTGIGALDAVWWSGLAIEGYGSDTVSWRFDSGSEVCAAGALPAAGGAVPSPAASVPPHPTAAPVPEVPAGG